MDDLFKILIWGLIIFFFLKPLFKKKAPEKKNTVPKPGIDSETYGDLSAKESAPAAISNSKDEYDILNEIQNMFKSDLKIPEQQKPKQVDPYDIYEPNEIKDKDLNLVNDPRMQREVEDQKPIGYRKTYDKRTLSPQREQKRVVDAQTEAEAQKFEKVLAGLHKKSAGQTEFIRKMKNPKSIREYIIFSEIIGKPKALHR